MKTEEKLEIKCEDVQFQYRTALYETTHVDILELKNEIKISVFEIKMSNGFNRRLEKMRKR